MALTLIGNLFHFSVPSLESNIFFIKDLNISLYIHTKVATTLIKDYLYTYLATKNDQFNYIFKKCNLNPSLLADNKNIYSFYSNQTITNVKNSKKIVFIRNPWSRLVSWFCNKFIRFHNHPFERKLILMMSFFISNTSEKAGFNFREFINFLYIAKKELNPNMFIFGDPHLTPQSYRFENTIFDEIYDHADVNTILSKFNKELNFDYTLRTLNQTKRCPRLTQNVSEFYPKDFEKIGIPDYKYFYDDDLIEKVAFIYQEDIEQFGFTFSTGYTGK